LDIVLPEKPAIPLLGIYHRAPRDTFLSLMVGWEHPHLYLSGSGRASQKTAISGSCDHTLLGICNIVLV